jgi:hypothetical protein
MRAVPSRILRVVVMFALFAFCCPSTLARQTEQGRAASDIGSRFEHCRPQSARSAYQFAAWCHGCTLPSARQEGSPPIRFPAEAGGWLDGRDTHGQGRLADRVCREVENVFWRGLLVFAPGTIYKTARKGRVHGTVPGENRAAVTRI